jgi:hypothetical protein
MDNRKPIHREAIMDEFVEFVLYPTLHYHLIQNRALESKYGGHYISFTKNICILLLILFVFTLCPLCIALGFFVFALCYAYRPNVPPLPLCIVY